MLVDLGAQLETDLADAEASIDALAAALGRRKRKRIKPGAKLALNIVAIIGGFAFAPVTIGASLIASAIGIGVTAWDGIAHKSDAKKALQRHGQVRRVRADILMISGQLDEIEAILQQRFPPR